MKQAQQDEIIGRLRGIARRNGWAIVSIGAHGECAAGDHCASGHEIPFAYTVGLSRTAGVELIVTGLEQSPSRDVLDGTADLIAAGVVLPIPGVRIPEGAVVPGYGLLLRTATDRSRFRLVRAVYGPKHRFHIVQVVYPDRDRRFPGDPGYSLTAAHQPMV